MSPDTKLFEPETENTPGDWPRFSINQEFELNGVKMRVRKITKKDVILRPLGQKA
jgi:hypothetical protein